MMTRGRTSHSPYALRTDGSASPAASACATHNAILASQTAPRRRTTNDVAFYVQQQSRCGGRSDCCQASQQARCTARARRAQTPRGICLLPGHALARSRRLIGSASRPARASLALARDARTRSLHAHAARRTCSRRWASRRPRTTTAASNMVTCRRPPDERRRHAQITQITRCAHASRKLRAKSTAR